MEGEESEGPTRHGPLPMWRLREPQIPSSRIQRAAWGSPERELRPVRCRTVVTGNKPPGPRRAIPGDVAPSAAAASGAAGLVRRWVPSPPAGGVLASTPKPASCVPLVFRTRKRTSSPAIRHRCCDGAGQCAAPTPPFKASRHSPENAGAAGATPGASGFAEAPRGAADAPAARPSSRRQGTSGTSDSRAF